MTGSIFLRGARISVCMLAGWVWSYTPAASHAVIAGNEAPADSYHKVVIAIAHGCEGSPTLRVRVRIPDGIVSVRPQPKAGWELAVRKETLAQPVTGPHGATITEAVEEVTWSGRLADEHFDEFAMQVRLPDRPGQTLYFQTVQECEKGVHRWIEIPAAGQAAGDLKSPAPSVRLLRKRQAR